MKIDFNKLFTGQREKSYIVGIEELGKIFSGSTGWDRGGQLQQYSKSLYVFAAVNKIALKVAAIDLELYKIISKDGETDEIMTHEVLDLLTKVNPFQTRSEFLRTAWINKKLTGEAFWLKVRNESGIVSELWNLRPDYMTIVADAENYIRHYELNKSDGSKELFMPEDIIYFKDPNPTDALRGMSPVAVSSHRIETEEGATRFQKDFFNNNARPDALLITEESFDNEQRTQMTSAWEERHGGRDKTSKIGILEGGMKYQQVSISQKEMDFIESLKFTRDDILVAFGVPKGVITTDDVNYANAEASMKMFLSETIKPEMDQLTEVLNEMLVIPEFGEEYILDNIDPTPQDRQALREDSVAAHGKWMTTNEIREAHNLPELEGGDEIAKVTPAQQQIDNQPNEEAKKKLKKAALKRLRGRPNLRMKFEVAEIITKGLNKPLKVKTKKAKVGEEATEIEDRYLSLMPDVEIRQKFYEYTNKKLDKKSKDFENTLVKEFAYQEDRILKALKKYDDDQKGIYTKMSHSDIANLMNVKKETRLFSVIALPFMLNMAEEGGEDAANLVNEDFDMTEDLKRAIDKRSHFFASSVTDTTFRKLSDTLSAGINEGEGIAALTARVQDVYKEIPEWRANMIARTETTNANNEGALEAFEVSEVIKGKEWIATMDLRTRDSHTELDGEIVSVQATFSNGLRFPGDIGPASETINCRCVIAPALYEKA
jgi:HK97 family phage portal protein